MRKPVSALFVVMLLAYACCAFAQAPAQPAQSAQSQKRTVNGTLDRSLSNAEKEFVEAADAMPEDKYGFAPSTGEFKGVRNFGEQVRHVATTNYAIGSAISGEKPPVAIDGDNENGPNLKSKAEIMKYLRDSFAFLHKSLGGINDQNLVEPIDAFGGKANATRLGMATLAVAHPFDHYGQMVEYLRMNGIVPPASRK
jgi:uncharacterized damage-inducible protein DinB